MYVCVCVCSRIVSARVWVRRQEVALTMPNILSLCPHPHAALHCTCFVPCAKVQTSTRLCAQRTALCTQPNACVRGHAVWMRGWRVCRRYQLQLCARWDHVLDGMPRRWGPRSVRQPWLGAVDLPVAAVDRVTLVPVGHKPSDCVYVCAACFVLGNRCWGPVRAQIDGGVYRCLRHRGVCGSRVFRFLQCP